MMVFFGILGSLGLVAMILWFMFWMDKNHPVKNKSQKEVEAFIEARKQAQQKYEQEIIAQYKASFKSSEPKKKPKPKPKVSQEAIEDMKTWSSTAAAGDDGDVMIWDGGATAWKQVSDYKTKVEQEILEHQLKVLEEKKEKAKKKKKVKFGWTKRWGI